MDIYFTELGTEIRMINIYGPCHHWENFWEPLLSAKILQSDNIILGGDLNFSLGFRDSWRSAAQFDPITDYMTNLLEQTNFMDIPMQRYLPTWRNRRVGDVALARRLDRFIMKGPLL